MSRGMSAACRCVEHRVRLFCTQEWTTLDHNFFCVSNSFVPAYQVVSPKSGIATSTANVVCRIATPQGKAESKPTGTGLAIADTADGFIATPALSTKTLGASDSAAVIIQPTPGKEGSGVGLGSKASTASKALQAAPAVQAAAALAQYAIYEAAQAADAATSSSESAATQVERMNACIVSKGRVCVMFCSFLS
jgi:hypothetical protein